MPVAVRGAGARAPLQAYCTVAPPTAPRHASRHARLAGLCDANKRQATPTVRNTTCRIQHVAQREKCSKSRLRLGCVVVPASWRTEPPRDQNREREAIEMANMRDGSCKVRLHDVARSREQRPINPDTKYRNPSSTTGRIDRRALPMRTALCCFARPR